MQSLHSYHLLELLGEQPEIKFGRKSGLKGTSGVGMIDDKIKDNTAMNSVSNFSHYFSSSPCEITQ